jgi:hypothetical protein
MKAELTLDDAKKLYEQGYLTDVAVSYLFGPGILVEQFPEAARSIGESIDSLKAAGLLSSHAGGG